MSASLSSCFGKMPFQSPYRAWMAATRRKYRVAYRCDVCGLWHTGGTSRAFRLANRRPEPEAKFWEMDYGEGPQGQRKKSPAGAFLLLRSPHRQLCTMDIEISK